MRIDAHAHLWDPAERDYGWLRPSLGLLYRRYGPGHLSAALRASMVDAAVVVQAAAAEEETRALLGTAAGRRDIVGVVGWVDVERDDVTAAIERLQAAPGGERLVGIRVDALPQPSGWLASAPVVARIAEIATAGLTVDLLADAERLPAVARLAAALPDARIVLNHLAQPAPPARDLEAWDRALGALESNEGVHVKLSGLVAIGPDGPPSRPVLERIVNRALDVFGPHRTMFGSDWPVCLRSRPHQGVVCLAGDLFEALEAADQASVWAGTAESVYGLAARATS